MCHTAWDLFASLISPCHERSATVLVALCDPFISPSPIKYPADPSNQHNVCSCISRRDKKPTPCIATLACAEALSKVVHVKRPRYAGAVFKTRLEAAGVCTIKIETASRVFVHASAVKVKRNPVAGSVWIRRVLATWAWRGTRSGGRGGGRCRRGRRCRCGSCSGSDSRWTVLVGCNGD